MGIPGCVIISLCEKVHIELMISTVVLKLWRLSASIRNLEGFSQEKVNERSKTKPSYQATTESDLFNGHATTLPITILRYTLSFV